MRQLLAWQLLASLVLGVITQDSNDCPDTILCRDNYCNECYIPGCTPSTFPPEVLNGTWIKMFENLDDFCDCCRDVFIPDLEEGESCFRDVNGYTLPSKGLCGPGLFCEKNPDGRATCNRKTTLCHQEQDRYDDKVAEGLLGMDESRPVCDDHGYYKPLQCTFAGACRCVNRLSGDPEFGFVINLETANMEEVDCECAREMEILKELGCSMETNYEGSSKSSTDKFTAQYEACMNKPTSYFKDHLRCQPNGNYDKAQCVARRQEDEIGEDDEICFCLDSDLELNSTVVTIDNVHLMLECFFEDDTHYAGYYRPCEQEHRSLKAKAREVEEMDGTFLTDYGLPDCTYDGYYDLVQVDPTNPTKGHCVDMLNESLGDYSGNIEDMDCLCAQVRAALLPTDDRPICMANGSFRSFQCRAEKCYCVDKFGRQTSIEEDLINFVPEDCDV